MGCKDTFNFLKCKKLYGFFFLIYFFTFEQKFYIRYLLNNKKYKLNIIMKKLFVFVFYLLIVSCTQNHDAGTDFSQFKSPEMLQKNLPWLKELIKKAEADKTGNYLGCIWLVSYKGKDFFYTNMMLGSGGVMYWVFDCWGNHIGYAKGDDENNCVACNFVGHKHFTIEPGDLPELHELKYDNVVYAPKGCPCDKYLDKD